MFSCTHSDCQVPGVTLVCRYNNPLSHAHSPLQLENLQLDRSLPQWVNLPWNTIFNCIIHSKVTALLGKSLVNGSKAIKNNLKFSSVKVLMFSFIKNYISNFKSVLTLQFLYLASEMRNIISILYNSWVVFLAGTDVRRWGEHPRDPTGDNKSIQALAQNFSAKILIRW